MGRLRGGLAAARPRRLRRRDARHRRGPVARRDGAPCRCPTPAGCAPGCAAPAPGIGWGSADQTPAAQAQEALARQLDAEVRADTQALIRLHGLEGSAEGDDPGARWRPTTRCGCAWTKARRRSGAAWSAARWSASRPIVLSGGLTLGGGLLAGGLLGALGAAGLARCVNLVRGTESLVAVVERRGARRRSSRRRCCATSRSRTSAAAAATGPRASRRRTGRRRWQRRSRRSARRWRAVERSAAARRRCRRGGPRERPAGALPGARAHRSRGGARHPVRLYPEAGDASIAVAPRRQRYAPDCAGRAPTVASTPCHFRSPRSSSGSTSRRRIRTSRPSGSRRSPRGTAGPCAGTRSCSA